MVEITLVVLAGADLLVDLAANLSVSLSLLLDKGKDVELSEALRCLELIHNLKALFEGVGAATSTHKQDGGLDKLAQLLTCLIKVLLGIDLAKLGGLL